MFNMLDNKKTLIVVYKDELLVNQLKKMVETRDDKDDGQIVGTTDGTVNVVSWTEKIWLDNKKAGNVKDKVLFLGEIKGTDKLIPVIDVKFDEFGAKFGWAGNQAILYADGKELESRGKYIEFIQALANYPVPDMIKEANNIKIEEIQDDQKVSEKENNKEIDSQSVENESEKGKGPSLLKKAKEVIESSVDAVGKAGTRISEKAEDVFRDKNYVKRQMLFYGVVNVYNNHLEEFINS